MLQSYWNTRHHAPNGMDVTNRSVVARQVRRILTALGVLGSVSSLGCSADNLIGDGPEDIVAPPREDDSPVDDPRANESCIAGATLPCTCVDGAIASSQVCRADGSGYDSCQCGGQVDPPPEPASCGNGACESSAESCSDRPATSTTHCFSDCCEKSSAVDAWASSACTTKTGPLTFDWRKHFERSEAYRRYAKPGVVDHTPFRMKATYWHASKVAGLNGTSGDDVLCGIQTRELHESQSPPPVVEALAFSTPKLFNGDHEEFATTDGFLWGAAGMARPRSAIEITYNCYVDNSKQGWTSVVDTVGQVFVGVGTAITTVTPYGLIFSAVGVVLDVVAEVGKKAGNVVLLDHSEVITPDKFAALAAGAYWEVKAIGSTQGGYKFNHTLRIDSWGCGYDDKAEQQVQAPVVK